MVVQKEITKEILIEKYANQGMSYKDIAKDLGCSTQHVFNQAKKYGIISRRGGPRQASFVGKTFGFLTVVDQDSGRITCLCKCGTVESRSIYDLKRKGTRMCKVCRSDHISNLNWKGYEEISGDVWGRIVAGAKRRNLDLKITINDAWNLFIKQNKRCALSGLPIDFARDRRKDEITASLDRIDSSKGYIEGNVQWVHKDINRMKLDTEVNEFIKLCRMVTANSLTS